MWFEEERFIFDSSNGIYKVHGKIVKPLKPEVKGIVQISHGMCEYIDKYDDFIQHIVSKGFVVIGHDHIGHGDSVNQAEDYGFFAHKDGYKYMIEDLKKVSDIVRERYPDAPLYLLGHSMGSLIARCYAARHGDSLQGLILCGTVGPQPLVKAGIKFADLLSNQKGERYRSKMLYDVSLSFANIKFLPAKTRFEWVTSDEQELKKHIEDPKGGFIFTAKGYSDLFHLVSLANSEMLIKTVPKDLRIIFMSGDEDPVGENGEGVQRAFELYIKLGLQNVEMKLYPKKRHELLKEKNRKEIFEDITNWINALQ